LARFKDLVELVIRDRILSTILGVVVFCRYHMACNYLAENIRNSMMHLSCQKEEYKSVSHNTYAFIVIIGFFALTAFLLLLKLGWIVNYEFPMGSLLISFYLYQRHPVLYLSFVLWIWFVCAFIRRMADFGSGWTDPSPVLLAPFLASFVSVNAVFRSLERRPDANQIPFFLSGASVIYGFFIGLLNQPVNPVIIEFLGWFTPILLGFYVFANWRQFPSFEQVIRKTFLYGTLVVSIYGIIQFLTAPEWDKYWMDQVNLVSIGTAEPLEIRVFSMLHSPQVLGGMLTASLLLLFSTKSFLRLPIMIFGYSAFLLSSARSAWFSWLIGLIVYLNFLSPRKKFGFLVSILIVCVLMIPLVSMEPFAGKILPRLDTLSQTASDGSFQDRIDTFKYLFDQALLSVVGYGLGARQIAGNDQGILALLFSLGWIGSIPYLSGIFLGFYCLTKSKYAFQKDRDENVFVNAALSISVSGFSQIASNIATSGIIAVMIWLFLGAGIASIKYRQSVRCLTFDESFL
jgi:hypothetical protein